MEYTYRQKRLIHKYIETHDIDQTAKYADLPKSYVIKFVHDNKKKLEFLDDNRTYISKDYVLKNLQEVVDRSMKGRQAFEYDKELKEMVPITSKDGDPVYEFDAGSSLKALELLGKHKKMFTDKVENQSTNIPYDEYIKKMDGNEY